MRHNAGMKVVTHQHWLAVSLLLWGCGTAARTPVVEQKGTTDPVATEPESSSTVMEPTSPVTPVTDPTVTRPVPATSQPQIVYRPADHRLRHDDEQLAALGIRRWSSTHLILYSDIEPEAAERLPALVDQLTPALVEYFGALPPAKNGRDFQMTGYLIRDLALFREAGLVPDDLPTFEHGRHRGYEFWLRDQPYAYYRAHLLLHEATHCFMTILPDQVSPVWYLEGMAEWFGTHQVDQQGRATFGTFPQRREDFPGWGRITLIQQANAASEMQDLAEIFALRADEFGEPTPYAWSWAVCEFLARHPRYRDRFRELGRNGRGPNFIVEMERIFAADRVTLDKEWALFIQNLHYGYDIERAAIYFKNGQPLRESQTVTIAADRGWQSTGVQLQSGSVYRITATGQVVLATEPKPWISEANGVSIDYFGGQPLGRLLGCLDPLASSPGASMLQVLPLGSQQEMTAPFTGTLYLRVNDAWSRLADNTGAYEVTIEAAALD